MFVYVVFCVVVFMGHMILQKLCSRNIYYYYQY